MAINYKAEEIAIQTQIDTLEQKIQDLLKEKEATKQLATYEDVHAIALSTWGASIDRSISRGMTTDRARYMTLLQYFNEHPNSSTCEINNYARLMSNYLLNSCETQYDIDIRAIQNEITILKDQLAKIKEKEIAVQVQAKQTEDNLAKIGVLSILGFILIN